MSVLTQVFEQGNRAFVAYITAGHRGLGYTEQAACALVDGGVDILEIGVPFSDPIADGPIIQAAMTDALTQSTSLHAVLDTTTKIKQQAPTPIVLFTYYNPLLAYGLDSVFKDAAAAGVDGILIVDLPLEESTAVFDQCQLNAIAPICLISPSTDESRISAINQHCRGFLYYVCRNGTTGVRDSLPSDVASKLETIKSLSTTPVVTGFGIANRALAAQACQHADGFVVGSAFVDAISNGASPDDLKNLAIQIDPR